MSALLLKRGLDATELGVGSLRGEVELDARVESELPGFRVRSGMICDRVREREKVRSIWTLVKRTLTDDMSLLYSSAEAMN